MNKKRLVIALFLTLTLCFVAMAAVTPVVPNLTCPKLGNHVPSEGVLYDPITVCGDPKPGTF